MTLTALNFIIAGLAVWRLASLLANESGTFGMFERARRRAAALTKRNRFWKAFRLYEGVCCEWCNSIWFSALVVILLGWHPLTILALSAFAILTKYTVQTLEGLCTYVDRLNKLASQINPDSPVDRWTMNEINNRALYVSETTEGRN